LIPEVVRNNNLTLISVAKRSSDSCCPMAGSTDGGGSWNNISGATNPNLTLVNLSTSDNGNKYRAIYTNFCGTATTNVTTLAVGAPINIGNVPPANAVGCNSFGNVSFTADANGGNGTVYMSWQYSADGVTLDRYSRNNNNFMIGNFSTTYTFTPTAGQNGYLFRAKFFQWRM
jgi:hypothetical protein